MQVRCGEMVDILMRHYTTWASTMMLRSGLYLSISVKSTNTNCLLLSQGKTTHYSIYFSDVYVVIVNVDREDHIYHVFDHKTIVHVLMKREVHLLPLKTK